MYSDGIAYYSVLFFRVSITSKIWNLASLTMFMEFCILKQIAVYCPRTCVHCTFTGVDIRLSHRRVIPYVAVPVKTEYMPSVLTQYTVESNGSSHRLTLKKKCIRGNAELASIRPSKMVKYTVRCDEEIGHYCINKIFHHWVGNTHHLSCENLRSHILTIVS